MNVKKQGGKDDRGAPACPTDGDKTFCLQRPLHSVVSRILCGYHRCVAKNLK